MTRPRDRSHSVGYIYPGGDEIIISYRLLRFTWQALTHNPSRTLRSLADEYGLRSPGNVATAVQILRERGKLSRARRAREVLVPYHEDNEFAE